MFGDRRALRLLAFEAVGLGFLGFKTLGLGIPVL